MMISIIKNNILYVIALLIGLIIGIYTCSYFKNKTIENLTNDLSSLKTQILKQDNEYKKKLLDIDTATKIKEKENYENYQKTIIDNQNRIDSLQSSNSGLRVKIKQLTRTETISTESSGMGYGRSSTTGQTAELDTTTSTNTLRIMQRCDKYKEQLTALQDYINTYNSKLKN